MREDGEGAENMVEMMSGYGTSIFGEKYIYL